MKGHTENGKFHPHRPYKGIRKSRGKSAKEKGVKIRKGRDQDLIYAESYNRGQNIKVVGHGNDWMLLVDRNVVGRATSKEEIFEMYDKVNVQPKTDSPQFYDPRSPRSFRERKARDTKAKIRKGRWDDSNFIVMKVKNERIGSKEFTDEAKQNLSEREYFETKNLGEAIRAVDEGRGNIIMDKDTENIMSSSLKKRDVSR